MQLLFIFIHKQLFKIEFNDMAIIYLNEKSFIFRKFMELNNWNAKSVDCFQDFNFCLRYFHNCVYNAIYLYKSFYLHVFF